MTNKLHVVSVCSTRQLENKLTNNVRGSSCCRKSNELASPPGKLDVCVVMHHVLSLWLCACPSGAPWWTDVLCQSGSRSLLWLTLRREASGLHPLLPAPLRSCGAHVPSTHVRSRWACLVPRQRRLLFHRQGMLLHFLTLHWLTITWWLLCCRVAVVGQD